MARGSGQEVKTRRAVAVAVFVTAIGIMSVASTTLGATFGPTQVLRIAGANSQLIAGEVEARGRQLAVTWTELRPGGNFGLIRLSDDGGQSFDPRIRLPAPHSGAGLDVCDARAWTLVTLPSGRAGIDGFPFEDGSPVSEDYTGVTGTESAYVPYLACIGHRRLVGAWQDMSTSPPHIRLHIRPFPGCVPCGALPTYSDDLGSVPAVIGGAGPYLDATNNDVYVAWLKGVKMKFKHYSIANDDLATVTPHPTRTLFEVAPGSRFSQVAAEGSRVVLSYQDGGDTKIRISEDRGGSFGPEILVVDGSSEPTSVDLMGQYILVGILDQSSGGRGWGMLSPDMGATFTETSSHNGGGLGGELYRVEGLIRIAEVWDQYYANPGSPKLRFHTGTP